MSINKNIKTFSLSETEKEKLKLLGHKLLIEVDKGERLRIFKKIIGKEKADWFNDYFEKNFHLKYQKEGMLKWANEAEMKPKWKNEVIRKITSLKTALTKQEEESFYEELAKLSLGLGITEEEIKTITQLSQSIEDAKEKIKYGGSSDELEQARKNMKDYVDSIVK
jgi:hypothetical protein